MARLRSKAPGFKPRPTDAEPRRRIAWIYLAILVVLAGTAIFVGS